MWIAARRAWLGAVLAASTSMGCQSPPPVAPDATYELPPADARVAAPPFADATGWLNVERPLSLSDLKGRVVVVDFWTSGCINCIHTVPTLARLERELGADGLIVVGVHSPKFAEESEESHLRHMLRSYGIGHPVALDADKDVWRAWDVHAWPTVFVLDAAGRVVWQDRGEPSYDELSAAVRSAIEEARTTGTLDTSPLSLVRPEPAVAGGVRYPEHALPLADGSLAIADTGQHRVVIEHPDGTTSVFGDGRAGFVDGHGKAARFRSPRGLAARMGLLYVADTNNHAIREIDVASGRVRTIAGVGSLGRRALPPGPRPALGTGLRSPWGLATIDDRLLIALAGSHQIAELELDSGILRRLAGTGKEALIDGTFDAAAFAQPSALSVDAQGQRVFVADTEASAVRVLDLRAGSVRTLVGEGLFVFGDRDGPAKKARLQHPTGLHFDGTQLWVADSYNGKLKRIDAQTGRTTTFASADLLHPASVAAYPGDTLRLAIADSHAHQIVAVDVESKALRVVELHAAPPAGSSTEAPPAIDKRDPVADLGEIALAPDQPNQVFIRWQLPAGTKVNAEGPARILWVDSDGLAGLPASIRATGAEVAKGFAVTLSPSKGATQGQLRGVLQLVLCDEEIGRVCLPVRRTLSASLSVRSGAVPRAQPVSLPPAR